MSDIAGGFKYQMGLNIEKFFNWEVEQMDVQKIMVVGSGQMGSGIAQVCAQAGYESYYRTSIKRQWTKGWLVYTGDLQNR